MRTHLEIRRIELWSLFKLAFFVYAAIGLIMGLFYGLFMLIAGGVSSAIFEEELSGLGIFGGLFGLVLIPVIAFLYGAMGSVMLTIAGFILNGVMSIVGGLRFETNVEMPPQAPPVETVPAPSQFAGARPAATSHDRPTIDPSNDDVDDIL